VLTGRSIYRNLSRELEDAHTRYAEAAQALRGAESRHEELLAEESRIVEELARVYLPDLSPASVSLAFSELRANLESALDAQEERRDRLSRDAVRAGGRVKAARTALDRLEEDAGALAERLREARARVEAVLESDDRHEEHVEEHAALMDFRERLLRRRARLGAAASAERPRYERDRLFRYLHDRDWGGPAYRAGSLTRRLDHWLARRIEYEALARSYRILKVGPHQLAAEIRRLGAQAEEVERAIDRREEDVARAEGLLALLEERVATEERLTGAQAELDQARSTREAVERELRSVEAHRGRHFEEAVELYREHLEGKTVRELEALARGTPDPRDDGLVRELDEVRAALERASSKLARRRAELARASERVERLSRLHGSGLQRFAQPRVFFPDGLELGGMVERLIRGDAGPEDLIAELDDAHREEAFVTEVPGPYFESVYRELTAAFDAGLEGRSVVEAHWDVDGEVETEVVVHDAEGRVIRRRVTRRALGAGEGDPESS
jgi:hypothetical protein